MMNEDIQKKQEKIKTRQALSAQMLLNSKGYPTAIINKMQTAFDNEDFLLVQEIAANYDIQAREALSTKITMIRNPEFKKMDIGDIQDELESNLFEKLSTGSDVDRLLEIEQECLLKQKELESVPILFKADGVDESFTTASQAIKAYKEFKGIQTNVEKHQFRKAIVHTGDLEAKIRELKLNIDNLERENPHQIDQLEKLKIKLTDIQKELEVKLMVDSSAETKV